MTDINESFRTLAANIPNMVYRVHLKEGSRMEFFNNMLEPMTGCTAAELSKGEVCSIDPLIMSEDRRHVLKSVKEAVAENRPFEVEYRLRHKNGGIRHFLERGMPIYGHDGKPLFIDGVIVDITHRKSSEEALRASEEKFRQLAENIREVFWIGSPDWNEVFYVSPAYEELWGRSCESLHRYPRSWLEAVVEEDREQILQDLKRMSAGDLSEPEFCEYRIVRPDGSVRWVYARAFPVRNTQGEIYRIAGIAEDITERKKAEAALRKAHEELQLRVYERTAELTAANKELRRRTEQLLSVSAELVRAEQRERSRLAMLIHDHLQQFLVAAKMGLELLSDHVAEDRQQDVANIFDMLTKSIQISRSLSAELSPPVLHKHGLTAAMEWLARWMKQNYQLTVKLQVTGQKIQIPNEQIMVLLFQSVRELLFNVVKHARVTTATLRMMRNETDHLRIVVSDQGAGFDPSTLREGLEPAAGFGLLTVRDRLTMLGGRLEVNSTPGEGTTITLIAPLEETGSVTGDSTVPGMDAARPQEILESQLSREIGARPIRVLVVDDHIMVRQGLNSLLNLQADMAVVGEAADGEEAVQLALQLRPDVILMDVSMPKINGLEATKLIHSKLPRTRIIGLSMLEAEDQAVGMLQAGAAAYLSKTCDAETLLTAIRENAVENV
jgi:PAS domain S-box-containing protein